MRAGKKYLALDMGAESGRGMVGILDNGQLSLEETHRFPNDPVFMAGGLRWNLPGQFSALKTALGAAIKQVGPVQSLGIDTWGVDFGFLGADGDILGLPYHYRDSRTNGMMEAAFEHMSREEVFEHTGIQFMPLNSLFQLLAMVRKRSSILKSAQTLLFMPDLFNYLFTGRRISEFSIATTSQMYDVRRREWSVPLFERLGLPLEIMPQVQATGFVVDHLLKSVADETGAGAISVVAPACHDTGSAVVAVPAQGRNWAYLSSGTWSLIGVELPSPLITAESLRCNFTNEGGYNGTTRFLKNIMGLWIVQQCRRQWAAEGQEYDYAEMARLAEEAAPFPAFINPNDASFAGFCNMPEAIRAFCRRTDQAVPETPGAILRCAFESLALLYRKALASIESMTGTPIETLHIVGGGTKNRLLNQLTANALGIPVVTGPVEATAAGNILVQAIVDGEVASLEEARAIVRASFEVETFEPRDQAAWQDAIGRFDTIVPQL